jgi:hypothetical protein
MKKWINITIIGILSIILVGFLIPQNLKKPIVSADSNDYNHVYKKQDNE